MQTQKGLIPLHETRNNILLSLCFYVLYNK